VDLFFSGKLIENGSGKYNVLCSAYLIEGNGFGGPIFITNEETDEGIVIAYDGIDGNKTEMPWLGKFSHENTILVPEYRNEIVLLGAEDGEYDHSQLYMYVAKSPSYLMDGSGKLYVFVGDGNNITNSLGNREPLCFAISASLSSSTISRISLSACGFIVMPPNLSIYLSHSAYLVMIIEISALTLIPLELASFSSRVLKSSGIRIVFNTVLFF
jgi:hypothetical protein